MSFYKRLEELNKKNMIESFLNKIPGLSLSKTTAKPLRATKKELKEFGVALKSMTEEEIKNPSIINESRRKRIAKGAGVEKELIKEFLSRFRNLKKRHQMSRKDRLRKMRRKMR